MMGWGAWQCPSGALAWGALSLGCAAAAAASSRKLCAALDRRLARAHPGRVAALVALASAALSALYVPLVLRGGPRIVDATAYWLQSRVLATGHVSFATEGPASSYRGRFLLEIAPGSFAGIFPPGYPALLAVFQWLGSPWLLGPLLAAALCALTARLTWLLAPAPTRSRAAWCAASLSLLCGAARYHTAEPMAHGLTMVAVAAALVAILDPRGRRGAVLLAGACLGVVATTRFASALALGAVLVFLSVVGRDARSGICRVAWLALAAAPFAIALASYQQAITGSPWLTPQALYYARSDAPVGCFRYGFGAGVGCVLEHGDFVKAHLPNHVYGAWEALGTSLRRLRLHALDIASFEPLLALVVVGAARLRHRGRALLWAYPLLVVAAYAPFYFDGNYPGGGARFFTDALPLEHALLAIAVAHAARPAFATIALSAFGFALHAAPEHQRLRDRDGGMPMWTPAATVPPSPLLLTNTDHGFALGHDPAAGAEVVVARLRGDANDALSVARVAGARLALFDVERGFSFRDYAPVATSPWRFEGESEWPVRAVRDATALAVDAPSGCSAGRMLALEGHADDASVTTSLWLPRAGSYRLGVRAIALGEGVATVRLRIGAEVRELRVEASRCTAIALGELDLGPGDHDLIWMLDRASFGLDAVEVGEQGSGAHADQP